MAVMETLKANGMRDGAHIRMTLTRGEKITSGMDPRLNQRLYLIILAEWKAPVYGSETYHPDHQFYPSQQSHDAGQQDPPQQPAPIIYSPK